MNNDGKKQRKPRSPKAAARENDAPQPEQAAEEPARQVEQPGASAEPETAEPETAEPTVTVDELVAAGGVPAGDGSSGDGSSGERPEPTGNGEPAEPPVSSELKAIVEALIYASPEPLTPKALCKVLDSEPKEDVERALAALKRDYQQMRGLQLVEIAGGVQIVTRPDLNEWVRRLFHERKSTRLSVQSLETLAVIAYRQPVTAAEIAEIRGVNTSGVLATLVERKLIKTAGRKAVVGRPFLYATTREFLLRFGLNDLSDLPKVDDLADVLGFELPGLLNEGYPVEPLLPLGEPDEAPADGGSELASEPVEAPGEPIGDPGPIEAEASAPPVDPGDLEPVGDPAAQDPADAPEASPEGEEPSPSGPDREE